MVANHIFRSHSLCQEKKHVSNLSASAVKPGEEEQPGLESPKGLGLQQGLATHFTVCHLARALPLRALDSLSRGSNLISPQMLSS